MQSTLLLGSDHTDLGEFTIEALTQDLAIGISRGRFPKGYAHVDPNEDAIFATTDGTTSVLAVADGHNGIDAARAAIEAISAGASTILLEPPTSIVRELTRASIRAVASTVPERPGPRSASRTALTICVVRDRHLASITIGDTACLVMTRRRTQRVGSPSPFLGPDTDAATITFDELELPARSVVAVASDGFTDFAAVPHRVLRSKATQPAQNIVEDLISAAFAGGAGDNIAIGLLELFG